MKTYQFKMYVLEAEFWDGRTIAVSLDDIYERVIKEFNVITCTCAEY